MKRASQRFAAVVAGAARDGGVGAEDIETVETAWINNEFDRDACAGERAVKSKGTLYLPRLEGMSDPGEYASYLDRATFYPFTGKTSAAYALAGELRLKLCALSLTNPKLTDNVMADLLQRTPPRSLAQQTTTATTPPRSLPKGTFCCLTRPTIYALNPF